MKNLQGKNAILTGGSYGVGPIIAKALAAEGVNLSLVARSADKLKQTASEVRKLGIKAITIPVDLTNPKDRQAMVAKAKAELGQIDILINNASVHHGGRLHTRSLEQIEQVIQTNLIATMQLTRMLLSEMILRKQGHVVHLASVAGKAGIPYIATYTASKYGIVGFNHSLQAELAGTGVRSSAVCPGYVRSNGMWARLNRKVHPAFGLSKPEDIAKAVVKAIKHNKIEIIVNPLPVRPVIALWALAPNLAAGLFKLLGVNTFMRGAGMQIEAEGSH